MKKQNRYGCFYYHSIKKYWYLELRDMCWDISTRSLLMPADGGFVGLVGVGFFVRDKRSLERILGHVQADGFGVVIKEVKGCLGCL